MLTMVAKMVVMVFLCSILKHMKAADGLVNALILLMKLESVVAINEIDLICHLFSALDKLSSYKVTEFTNSLFVNFNCSRLLVAWSYSQYISSIAEKSCGLDKPEVVAHEDYLLLKAVGQRVPENVCKCVGHDGNQHVKEDHENHASGSDPHYKHGVLFVSLSVVRRHIEIQERSHVVNCNDSIKRSVSEVDISVRIRVTKWECLICNENEISESQHNNKSQKHEWSCIRKSLHDKSDVICIAWEQSKPIEDLEPHEEHRP